MSLNHSSSNLVPESAYNTADKELAATLERLDDLVSNLRHRLAPVLVPGGDGKELPAGDLAARMAPAPLVQTLEHHTARADRIGDDVNDLLRRLCL